MHEAPRVSGLYVVVFIKLVPGNRRHFPTTLRRAESRESGN